MSPVRFQRLVKHEDYGKAFSHCMQTLAGASAFATSQAVRERGCRSRCPKNNACFNPAQQLGAMDPLGYWDPAGFMKDADENQFRRFREAELKHGRVAMLAGLGEIASCQTKFFGFDATHNGFAGVLDGPGGAGFGMIVLAAGFFELDWWKQDPAKPIGAFYTPSWAVLDDSDPADLDDLKMKELNNGRLAMSAVITGWVFEYHNGAEPLEQIQQLSEFAKTTNGLLFFTLYLLLPIMVSVGEKEKKLDEQGRWQRPMAAIEQGMTSAAQGLLCRDEKGRYRFSV